MKKGDNPSIKESLPSLLCVLKIGKKDPCGGNGFHQSIPNELLDIETIGEVMMFI